MKTHRYCFPMRIVAMLLVLILCLDFSGASVFAAEKPQQSDTEKELALDWLTEMTGSREEAELFYARMDALGLLNGDLEPGASKLTIAGKDYTLEEAKAVLDSFADDEPVAISFCYADTGIEGYLGMDKSLVRSVNGVKVRNLRHLTELVDQCHDGFVRFNLDRDEEWDAKLVVDAREMREATVRVMKRNLIPADRSEDLRTTPAK